MQGCLKCQERLERIEVMLQALVEHSGICKTVRGRACLCVERGTTPSTKRETMCVVGHSQAISNVRQAADVERKVNGISLLASIKTASSHQEALALIDAWNASRRKAAKRRAK